MDKKIKLLIVNEACQLEYFSRRWKLFADRYPNVDVTILVPSKMTWYKGKKYTFGEPLVVKGREIDDANFHIHSFKRIFTRSMLSLDFTKYLKELQPDIVHHIGFHWQPSLVQIGMLTKKYLPNAKLTLFSMRGPAFDLINRHGLEKIAATYIVKYVNKNYNAVFCHYPGAIECFRREKYTGPIYMQTQVGVNTEWFYPNEQYRNEIRKKYSIDDDTFVFGSASRFSTEKGIDDILNALPEDGNWKYLLIGSGTAEEIERLKELIKQRRIEDKVILTGFIDMFDIAKYWNAIDCAIHVPRTTKEWVETFSLSAVQPQAVGKPIIGNTSGSVPYQIGYANMIVPEGDIDALSDKILWVLQNKEEAASIGEKMYNRTINSFSVEHLNDMFYDTMIEDVLNGLYDKNKIDMTSYIPKKHTANEY